MPNEPLTLSGILGGLGGVGFGAVAGFTASRGRRAATRNRRRFRQQLGLLREQGMRAAEISQRRGSLLGEQSEFLRSAFGGGSEFTRAIGSEIGAAQAQSGLFSAGRAAAEQAALGQSVGTQRFRSTLLGGLQEASFLPEQIRQETIAGGLQRIQQGFTPQSNFGRAIRQGLETNAGLFARQLRSGTDLSGARSANEAKALSIIESNRALAGDPNTILGQNFQRFQEATGEGMEAFLRQFDPGAFRQLEEAQQVGTQNVLREEFRESFRQASAQDPVQQAFLRRRAAAAALGQAAGPSQDLLERFRRQNPDTRGLSLQQFGALGATQALFNNFEGRQAGLATLTSRGRTIEGSRDPLGNPFRGLTGAFDEAAARSTLRRTRNSFARLGGLAGNTLSRRLGIA